MKKAILILTAMVGLNINMPKAPPIDPWKLVSMQDIKFKEELTPKNVYQFLIRQNIRFADIVFRQVLHETGYLTSWICREKNNLFGMTKATKSIDSMPTQLVYHHYTDWKQSVLAYKNWQTRHIQKGRDVSDYYQFLVKVRYAEDPLYIWKLKKIDIKKYLI